MSQSEKAAYFRALKAAGVPFDRHYREYNTEELKAAYGALGDAAPPLEAKEPEPAAPPPAPAVQQPYAEEPAEPVDPEAAAFFGFNEPEPVLNAHAEAATRPAVPVAHADPNEMAGARQNSKPDDEPIRVDPDTGRLWYQEEVRKPGYPKPRGRRVLNYMDPGVEQRTAQAGEYKETFEVSGDPRNARPAQVKITLPSYQVGIFKDPRFPFKVITYNGNEGFDLFEVQDYYGGPELVPAGIKRKYVENVLCYDIRTVVQAINAEFRQLQLTGRVK